MELDAVGIPVRYTGERFQYQGRIFTVVKNLGLMVLCPCPDSLAVRYDDTDEDATIENSKDFQRIN
jgi:hypothetical protein